MSRRFSSSGSRRVQVVTVCIRPGRCFSSLWIVGKALSVDQVDLVDADRPGPRSAGRHRVPGQVRIGGPGCRLVLSRSVTSMMTSADVVTRASAGCRIDDDHQVVVPSSSRACGRRPGRRRCVQHLAVVAGCCHGRTGELRMSSVRIASSRMLAIGCSRCAPPCRRPGGWPSDLVQVTVIGVVDEGMHDLEQGLDLAVVEVEVFSSASPMISGRTGQSAPAAGTDLHAPRSRCRWTRISSSSMPANAAVAVMPATGAQVGADLDHLGEQRRS